MEDPNDRLHETSHSWALRSASEVAIVVLDAAGSPVASTVARVATPGPLVAMKLQAVLLRPSAKEGTDLVDIVRLVLDPASGDAVLSEPSACDPVMAADAALHVRTWFVDRVERSIARMRAVGADDVDRETVRLVAELLTSATRCR